MTRGFQEYWLRYGLDNYNILKKNIFLFYVITWLLLLLIHIKTNNMAALSKKEPKELDLKWYRIFYGAFILLSLYFLLIHKHLSDALINGCIALVFDPFDQKVKWSERPLWQRIWLLCHLVILMAGLAILLFW